MRRQWLVAGATALAFLVSACGGAHETSSSAEFGEAAVAWREARYACLLYTSPSPRD